MNRRQQKRRLARRQAHGQTPDRPRNVLKHASYSNVKQGHIVPKTYQRNFAVDEQVSVHVPGRPDCVQLKVSNAGTRSRFYRRTRPDGTDIDDVEAMLDVVEGIAGPVLREVVEGAQHSQERKAVLAQFLAVQMLRGPAFFADQDLNVDRFIPATLTHADVKPALLAKTGGDLGLARQHVVDMFREPTQKLMTMTRTSIKVSAVLGSMRWQLLRFDDPVVAYSDQPVVVWPLSATHYATAPKRPLFAPLNALEVRIPLAPQLVLLMTWVDEPDVLDPVTAPAMYAAETNALVIGQADKQWMHMPGSEPPVVHGIIWPLSRAFENRYTSETAAATRRRQATVAYLHRVRNRRFINDVEFVTITSP